MLTGPSLFFGSRPNLYRSHQGALVQVLEALLAAVADEFKKMDYAHAARPARAIALSQDSETSLANSVDEFAPVA